MYRLCTVFLLVFAIGCAAPAQRPLHAPASPVFDRCADHLQEICGLILQYYVDNHQLPANIEQLQSIAAQQVEPPDLFVCPISKLRYIYNPDGIALYNLDPPARLVMYDAQPVHNGHRWGIAISPPITGHALICRVISIPGTMNLSAPTTQPAAR